MDEISKTGVNSPLVAQPPAEKQLLSFDDYERQLTPELRQIHELVRPSFLFRSYELAKKKIDIDKQSKAFKAQVPGIRASIARHKKISTQIDRALEAMAKDEDPELLTNLDVIYAGKLLAGAAADLKWIREELLLGFIHPDLRKGRAQKDRKAFRLPQHGKDVFPGFRPTASVYWLIGALDELLDIMLNRKGTQERLGRDRIIKRVFEVALAEFLDPHQITIARRRMAERRKLKTKKASI